MKEHKYTKYRPKWCRHGKFNGMDYCWGLATEVDKAIKNNEEFDMEEFCKNCDFNKIK